ncbi:MAG: hypothetical protein ACE5JS_11260 [Nitrospinota bacterium]
MTKKGQTKKASAANLESQIEAKRSEIVARMKELRRKLEAGDDSDLLAWVIPDALACAHRPLRHHPWYGGSGQPIPGDAKQLILDWVEQIRMEGIASIISFMHDRDLRCYQEIDLGGLNLTTFLEHEGFNVCPLPWQDPAHSRTDPAVKRKKLLKVRQDALEAYDRLPKPVLLLCSAGIDRSAPVAAYLWKKRDPHPAEPFARR